MYGNKYKVIDIHTHVYPENISARACENLGNFYNFPVSCKGTYQDLYEQANGLGFDGFLLFSVAGNVKNVERVNDYTMSMVNLSKSQGYETTGFMAMHQDYPDFKKEVERCEKIGLKGVKIHPDFQQVDIDSPKLLPLYEIIEGRLPIILHMGDDRPEYRYSEPKRLAKVLDIFPKLEVVAAHLGGYRAWDEAKEYLYGRPNVWYDNSSVLWAMSASEATEIMRACGTDRVMFGTDYPMPSLKSYTELFMKCVLTEKEREDIFYNNAKRFLKYD